MSKFETNTNVGISKRGENDATYDLEERTFAFAKSVRAFVKKLPRTIGNIEDVKQLVKSSGSIGANYIEANDATSKKDFLFRIKVARKESKESIYWLRLLDVGDDSVVEQSRSSLTQESTELMKILGAILRKSV